MNRKIKAPDSSKEKFGLSITQFYNVLRKYYAKCQ